MEIIITVFTAILLAAQFVLAAKQIKKGAPDGKILLKINIIVAILWTPLAIIRFLHIHPAVDIVWFVLSAIYMIFTYWYTKNLQRN